MSEVYIDIAIVVDDIVDSDFIIIDVVINYNHFAHHQSKFFFLIVREIADHA